MRRPNEFRRMHVDLIVQPVAAEGRFLPVWSWPGAHGGHLGCRAGRRRG